MRHILARDNVGLIAQMAASRVLVAFDFDGTLAPIVADRESAVMRPQTRRLLRAVGERFPCAVISGRRGADVAARLFGTSVKYVVGNHGIECDANGFAAISVAPAMSAIRQQIETVLHGVDGIDIEDKQFSLAIHYRGARRKRQARAAILAAVTTLVAPVRLVDGKLVVNVLPAGAPHKGDALLALRSIEDADTALYVGDDVTDEDVFALDQPGRLLSVRVGRSSSSSAWLFLRNQLEVDRLLQLLVDLGKARVSDARPR